MEVAMSNNQIIKEIMNSNSMKKKIQLWQTNNWTGTPWEEYFLLGPKQKGALGEAFVEKYTTILNHVVTPPEDTGHDRIIDGYKTEIKFSLASSNTKEDGKLIDPDSFTFNHIAKHKTWDRFIFCGINPNKSQRAKIRGNKPLPQEIQCYWMEKHDFIQYMKTTNPIFKPQQGGKKANNDDYILAGDISELTALPFIKPINLW